VKKDSCIFIAGETTMEGKALIRLFQQKDYSNITNGLHPEPELTNRDLANEYFKKTRPEYVFLFSGKSGGIKANQEMPATLMLDNLEIISNVMSAAHEFEVEKLLYLASSCVYPKYADQPMHPDMLMTSSLEPTNSAYAMAKLAGIELCRAYRKEHGDNLISAISPNIFGPGDDFSAGNSHVVAALMRKMHEAKKNGNDTVEIWGTGKPKREFIYVRDLADACLFLMVHYDDESPINIGSGTTMSISDLATVIKTITGCQCQIRYDSSKPDGMPQKTLDCAPLISLGWEPSISFETAIENTYAWFKANGSNEFQDTK
tara:strand:- start:69 stop:1019 length:951 start_codon:yes stop_codon:yes gene_type:complete